MLKEISGRISHNVIRYVQQNQPDALNQLLEGFDSEVLSNERGWITYQTANLLFRRAEKIFGRDDIMTEVGRSALALGALGVGTRLFQLTPNLNAALGLVSRYSHMFQTISSVTILQQGPGHMVMEDRCLPGFIRTRGVCHYVQGLFLAVLNRPSVHSAVVSETQCEVPIWEKGLLDDSYFQLVDGRIIRKNLLTGVQTDLGPLAPDGSFTYAGTVYGAPCCTYDIRWREHRKLLSWLINMFFFRPRLMESIRNELIDEYELVERQNERLRQANQTLAAVLKERTELNANLEAKVVERTRELGFTIERLKELDLMKSNFLSVTSHELRTPLTVIKGALSLMLAGGGQIPADKVPKYLAMAANNCDRLIKLIDELLDFSRLEAGAVSLDLTEVDLLQLAKETIEEFSPLAANRRLDLTSVLPSSMPLLKGHPGRIKQIISNLLSNAMKFTQAGGEVKLLLRRNDSYAEMVVADTGIGMTETQQKRVFSRFFQVDDTLTREVTGVGLGLAIVKELVEMHEGYIWVESEPDRGSRFFVRLPLAGPSLKPKALDVKKMNDWL